MMNSTVETRIESEIKDPCQTLAASKLGTLDNIGSRDAAFICISDFKHYVRALRVSCEIDADYAQICIDAAQNLERLLSLATLHK